MSKVNGLLLAILLAPLASVPTWVVYIFVFFPEESLFKYITSVLIIAYAGVTIIGVPIHLALNYLKSASLWVYVSIGFFLPVLLFAFIAEGSLFESDGLTIATPFAMCGAVTAASFWFIAGKFTPNKSFKL